MCTRYHAIVLTGSMCTHFSPRSFPSWVEVLDRPSGLTFYHHEKSSRYSWDIPPTLMRLQQERAGRFCLQAQSEEEWLEMTSLWERIRTVEALWEERRDPQSMVPS